MQNLSFSVLKVSFHAVALILNDNRVVEASCINLVLNDAEIVFLSLLHKENLPLTTVFGDSTELGASKSVRIISFLPDLFGLRIHDYFIHPFALHRLPKFIALLLDVNREQFFNLRIQSVYNWLVHKKVRLLTLEHHLGISQRSMGCLWRLHVHATRVVNSWASLKHWIYMIAHSIIQLVYRRKLWLQLLHLRHACHWR